MPSIKIKETESFDVGLRKFRRACERAGVVNEIRKREFYEKPTEERKRKAKEKMNEEQLDEFKKVEITLNNPNDAKKIKKDVIDLTNKKRKVNIIKE